MFLDERLLSQKCDFLIPAAQECVINKLYPSEIINFIKILYFPLKSY